ncbi:MAG: 3-oxoacyl-[acyl-carrier protein] reductase, partial [Chlamydiales bacterium]
GQVNYAASKSGMLGFSKSLAKELARRNICVNCIAPGYIETKMTEILPEQQKDLLKANIPMQRLGKPEDVANTALFLASNMSDFITGQVITVDGGMVM